MAFAGEEESLGWGQIRLGVLTAGNLSSPPSGTEQGPQKELQRMWASLGSPGPLFPYTHLQNVQQEATQT